MCLFTMSRSAFARRIDEVREGQMLLRKEELVDGSACLRRRCIRDIDNKTNVDTITAPLTMLSDGDGDGDGGNDKRQLPYMKNTDELHREQEVNHDACRMNELPSSEAWFAKFSKWSFYRTKRENTRNENTTSRTTPLRKHSSIRRKDYSTDFEVSEYRKRGQFIFHKGFSLRLPNRRSAISRSRSPSSPLRKRNHFQNEQELLSFMRYIDFSDMSIDDIVNVDAIRLFFYDKFSLKTLVKVNPNMKCIDIPTTQYFSTINNLQRERTTYRILKRPSIMKRQSLTKRKVRRSKTIQPIRISYSEKLDPELYSMWNAYLKSIIAKRISLRLACMEAKSIDSLSSSVISSSDSYNHPGNSRFHLDSYHHHPIPTNVHATTKNDYSFEDSQFKNKFSKNSITSRGPHIFEPTNHPMKSVFEETSTSSVTSRNTLI